MKEKFSAIEEIDYKVETFGSLKGVMKFHDEWMINPFKNHAFDSRVSCLALAEYHIFLQ